MTTQLLIKIDEEVKARISKLARLEGKTTSGMVRELIEGHIKERDISAYLDNLWGRIGTKLKTKGVTPSAIEKAIKASRKNKE